MTAAIALPETYIDGPPHDLFAQLRREKPVAWVEMTDHPGYWAVLRHADVVAVSSSPDIYSATEGGIVIEELDAVGLDNMRAMLLAMDPPRHGAYRRPIAGRFRARVIAEMGDRIRTITREILDRADQRGPELEFVHDVCAPLPSQVVGELMGIPPGDWNLIHTMAERNSGSQDADVADGHDRGSAAMEMAAYGMQFAAARRTVGSRSDLTDLLLSETFDGKPMTDVDFARFFVQLVTAGNDTTRSLLSSGLLTLLDHPAQLDELRADHNLIPGAVEEILRWANPLHYLRRTALADTVLGDVRIAAGDKVAMVYSSANRDETVFADPQRFDIRRDPNPHLAFGIAAHFCLGVHLARLEGRIFFEEVLTRWPRIELAGEPRRQRSNLNNSLKYLPVSIAP